MTHWACSDMHGYYSFYEQIKKNIDPEDKVICLGDCGDRGPQSWKLIKTVLNDPQFIYLKGNHEDMLAKALYQYFEQDFMDRDYYYLCSMNGGSTTFYDASCESDPLGAAKVLNNLPLEYHYTNPEGKRFCLCHAGFTGGRTWANLKKKEHDLIWDREHTFDPEGCFNTADFDVVIHGHTPIPFDFVDEDEFDGSPYTYCGGHKINIDAGSYYSKKGILFNLDTYESICFELTD